MVPLWTPNRPRFMPGTWMVHPIDIEPSARVVPSVEGSALDSEPSTIQARNVDGSLLKYEPSMISSSTVDGSPSGI